ncbi:protein L [Stenotrophomonas rhizophila]|uniref:protein L n=1 Tax=Stenotrophomonas rhizophila TaxID=216778 RepID=UPI0028A6C7CB|nr:protein L [Stenotrophomonas rhizophila]MDY0954088.1 protein L [Stenotrophomonas rhizophila]
MAWYVDNSNLSQVNPTHKWWTTTYDPGDIVPVSGIYRCQNCKREVTCNQNDPFPPQSHPQHAPGKGAIRWNLIVRTNTDGD